MFIFAYQNKATRRIPRIKYSIMKNIKDSIGLALVFGAAIVGENELLAAGLVIAALILQYDKIEALLKR